MRHTRLKESTILFFTSGAVFISQLFAMTVKVSGNRNLQRILKIQSVGCVNGR